MEKNPLVILNLDNNHDRGWKLQHLNTEINRQTIENRIIAHHLHHHISRAKYYSPVFSISPCQFSAGESARYDVNKIFAIVISKFLTQVKLETSLCAQVCLARTTPIKWSPGHPDSKFPIPDDMLISSIRTKAEKRDCRTLFWSLRTLISKWNLGDTPSV